MFRPSPGLRQAFRYPASDSGGARSIMMCYRIMCNKRMCHVGSATTEVEVAGFRYKWALMRNNECSLPSLNKYL